MPAFNVPGGVPETAAELRRTIYAHEPITSADIDLVFEALRKQGPDASQDWSALFSEAVSDYVVHQAEPSDYISDEKSEWLIGALSKNGGVSTKAEWSMLIDVMNHALGVPPALSAFALKEVATAIMSGRRGAFTDADHPAGVVTKADVDALRAVLFAATSGSACHITREEAEVLFDIAHATAKGRVDASFDDLFARCIGNYLMAISAHAPNRGEELHREKWLDEREKLPGFFSRIVGNKAQMRFLDLLKSPLELAGEDMGRLLEQDARDEAQSETITDSEADWVAAHLTRDAPLTSAETKLLQWLNTETHALPPVLKAIAEGAPLAAKKTEAIAAAKPVGYRHAS